MNTNITKFKYGGKTNEEDIIYVKYDKTIKSNSSSEICPQSFYFTKNSMNK